MVGLSLGQLAVLLVPKLLKAIGLDLAVLFSLCVFRQTLSWFVHKHLVGPVKLFSVILFVNIALIYCLFSLFPNTSGLPFTADRGDADQGGF